MKTFFISPSNPGFNKSLNRVSLFMKIKTITKNNKI